MLDIIPAGPIDRIMLAVTAFVFVACLVNGRNRIAISAILAGLLVHTYNQNVLNSPILYPLTDLATAAAVIASTARSLRFWHAGAWGTVLASHGLIMAGIAPVFVGGSIIKVAALLSTVLCLPAEREG